MCDMAEMRTFIRDIDEHMKLEGKLRDYMLMNKNLNNKKNDIKYDEIIEEIVKWCVAQEHIQPEDFSKILSWLCIYA